MAILTINKAAAKYVEAIRKGVNTNAALSEKFGVNISTVGSALLRARKLGIILTESVPIDRGGLCIKYSSTNLAYKIHNTKSGPNVDGYPGNRYDEKMYSTLDYFLYSHPDPKRNHG